MYSDVMQRTQIYLSDAEVELLDREARRTGASKSELIRRAIRERFGAADGEERRRALADSAGAWQDRACSGEAYVEALRRDADERLRALGL